MATEERISTAAPADDRPAPIDAGSLGGGCLDAAAPFAAASVGTLREWMALRGCGSCEVIDYEDVLEQNNASLAEWQRFVGSVLAAMSEILVASDRSGLVEKVNPALERLVGRSDEELRGTPLVDLLFDEVSCERAGRFARELHLGTVEDCELAFLCAGGSPQYFAVNCTPRLSPAGQYVGMVLTGRPVGELRRAYRELQAAHRELESTHGRLEHAHRALEDAHGQLERAQSQLLQSEKLASLGRLVAGVAHEINNPLSFVLGNVHTLARYARRIGSYLDAVHGEATREEVAMLRETLRIDRLRADLGSLIDGTVEGAERARDIVAGLRQFSAAERAPAAPFDLVEVLGKAVHWVRRATGSRIEVTVDAPGPAVVVGAMGEIQQVLMNLIQNAIDATEHVPRPQLEVRVRRAAPADHGTTAGPTGGSDAPSASQGATELGEPGRADAGSAEVIAIFEDNGPGFDPQHLPRVFDPFFTTKPVGKGIGLGLAISYGIVERHRGALIAGNRPGGGARVVLRLPAGR